MCQYVCQCVCVSVFACVCVCVKKRVVGREGVMLWLDIKSINGQITRPYNVYSWLLKISFSYGSCFTNALWAEDSVRSE